MVMTSEAHVPSAASVLPPTPPPSRLRRAFAFGAYGLLFATLGFLTAASPLVPGVWDATRKRSDEESLRSYVPEDAEAKVIDDFINKHPLAAEMRKNPNMAESRPHMKLPDALRRHNLTGGTLLGPGRITVPPVCWTENGGKSLVSISHLGTDVCGHPGIVHGGLLATMLDEGLARCCFGALPHNVGVTAQLEINYRKPVHAGTYVVLRAKTLKVEGRKAWVEGQLETLPAEGEEPVILAQAGALFVTPRFASVMAKLNATNITWHPSLSRSERNQLRKQRGFTIWLTGLSASGKSTVATALEQHLLHLGVAAYRLDGDNVRFGLNKDLGFSEKDRNENIRRIAEVAKLFADSSTVAITSFISPYRADRQVARELHTQASQGNDDAIPFIEIFVDVPIEVAEQRDPKGLYKKARAGEIKDFTGISAPYEEPENPEIRIRTDKSSVEECVAQIAEWLVKEGLISTTKTA
ncbi:hypothetical protein CkaCkLH20_13092 [Colletotrichum karsti]|uniref:Adenylyl-sulfate kinase n=1 Tax=Colletotrichum karsti TaxID=1095194 RepID=A0A9P6LED4_9PEZI|nr:uncharacterized protein CkaCkLH20_13092 [Colletotrichum karsti]KAF9869430.1 hypothetical protein CkaCkLH20_13092 [Colletotrichum karsti]